MIQPPTTDLTLEQCGHAFLSGSMFTDEQMFHGVTAKLRREAPVHWVEHPDFNPFYVVTKHADVLDVELHPAEFLNAQADGTRPQRASHVASFLRSVEAHAPGAVKKLYEHVELEESDDAPVPKSSIASRTPSERRSCIRLRVAGGSRMTSRSVTSSVPRAW